MNDYVVVRFKAGDKWHVHGVEEYSEIAGMGESSFIELKFKNGQSIHISASEVRAVGFEEEFKNVEEHEYEW